MAVEFLDGALGDIFEIATAYEAETPGLGERFIAAVGRQETRLDLFPRSGSRAISDSEEVGEQRRCRLREFPYLLLYEVVEGEEGLDVLVSAVTHGRRAPRRWSAD